MEPLVFDDIAPVEIPVKLKGKDYVLREASESGAAKYKNAQLKAMKQSESADGNKTTNIDGMAETEALLVSICLFEKTDTGEKNVDIAFIRTLVHRVVEPIFNKAEEISGLKKKKTKEELIKTIKESQVEIIKLNKEQSTGETDVKN